jgi:lipopolysaccharide/colanic/teichoic acid biosynthesis glycosyltransferase
VSKRTFDLLVAIPLLAAAIPVLAIAVAATRAMGDRGPALYRAVRIGEGGRAFEVLKLRTMRFGGEGPRVTGRDDPRITPIGRVLRRLKVDELPQLINVMRGEMSIVGPRPEDPSYIDWADPQHNEVFRALPGITGVSQLRYAREDELLVGADFELTYRTRILPDKVALDAWYLRHQSRHLDARIVLATVWRTLGGTAPRIGPWTPSSPT